MVLVMARVPPRHGAPDRPTALPRREAQRELTHSQNELQLGGRLVLAPFEALNTKSCVVSLRRASGAARERRFAGAVFSSKLGLFVDARMIFLFP